MLPTCEQVAYRLRVVMLGLDASHGASHAATWLLYCHQEKEANGAMYGDLMPPVHPHNDAARDQAHPSSTTTTLNDVTRPGHEAQLSQLSPLLVWAVVFCDIGTSVYYVPGILYQQVGNLAPLFVLLTTVGFILLSSKYVEISWRHPEGGGVVTVATKAFGPRWGCLGGMLITVDYFLTSAISSVSGIAYLGSLVPAVDTHTVMLSVGALTVLALVNVIGIRESALLALWMAAAALAVNLLVIGVTVASIGLPEWRTILQHVRPAQPVPWSVLLVGFASAWLAFSGLESISQLSPAMRLPARATAGIGMRLVVVTIVALVRDVG